MEIEDLPLTKRKELSTDRNPRKSSLTRKQDQEMRLTAEPLTERMPWRYTLPMPFRVGLKTGFLSKRGRA